MVIEPSEVVGHEFTVEEIMAMELTELDMIVYGDWNTYIDQHEDMGGIKAQEQDGWSENKNKSTKGHGDVAQVNILVGGYHEDRPTQGAALDDHESSETIPEELKKRAKPAKLMYTPA